MDKEKEQLEASLRDEIAQSILENLFNKYFEKYTLEEIGNDEKFKGIKPWMERAITNMARISYFSADAMRKARLGAFE